MNIYVCIYIRNHNCSLGKLMGFRLIFERECMWLYEIHEWNFKHVFMWFVRSFVHSFIRSLFHLISHSDWTPAQYFGANEFLPLCLHAKCNCFSAAVVYNRLLQSIWITKKALFACSLPQIMRIKRPTKHMACILILCVQRF